MGLISGLLTAPILGPAKGVSWLAERLLEAAEDEQPSEQDIHRALAELNRALDRGEIDETTFRQEESRLLDLLDELTAPPEADHDHDA